MRRYASIMLTAALLFLSGSACAPAADGWEDLARTPPMGWNSWNTFRLEINEELLRSPQTINDDPYGEGWVMKVKLPNMSANLKNLLSSDLAKKWLQQVQTNLLLRMSDANIGLLYQDGGVPVDGMAKNIDSDHWEDIIKEFFLTD